MLIRLQVAHLISRPSGADVLGITLDGYLAILKALDADTAQALLNNPAVICGTFIRICKYDIAKSNQAANPAAPQTSFTITINAATEVWSTPQDLLPRWNHAAAVR